MHNSNSPLRVPCFGRYIPRVAPHRATGFDSLITRAGSREHSVTRSFCARKTTCARLMAGRNGEAFAPAGFSSASLSTLLRLATMFDSVLARLQKITRGVPAMAKATPCPYPLFIWLFAAVSRADLTDHTPHMVRIAAPDELTARRSLVGRYVLSFAGRIPVQGVRYV
ncbi:host cell division inhibitor Icd-like protein [Salmonella enterica]|nr:host cell division inhibitor Icd-like protein [Salmonella enterica]